MADIFDRIRSSCESVAASADNVRINPDAIGEFAARLDPGLPAPDPGQIPIGDAESTAAFVMSLDSINFGSGYFPYLVKRPGMSGYHTIATCLRDFIESHGPITTPTLHQMTAPKCAEIFGQRLDDPMQGGLMRLFAEALTDLGGFVQDVGGGSFVSTIDEADHSAAALVQMLDQMPLYHDVHVHRGREVLLYKRAQIVAQDLAIAFRYQGPGRFDDLHRLTMFADNLVPHVLRIENVLTFSDSLIERIESVQDIPIGSTAEVEIRACALHAVEMLRDELEESGTALTSADLDNVLWNLGSADRYKNVRRHRTRCTFY